MKAFLMGLIIAVFSTVALADFTETKLTEKEIVFAVELSNKYHADFIASGPCAATSFELYSTQDNVREVDTYTFETSKSVSNLSAEEIVKLEELQNRLDVGVMMGEPGVFFKRIKIQGSSCGFTANTWTATYFKY